MNIVVLGAGAVGGYFGGRLASVGVPVTFLVRRHRYDQLRQRGLRVQSVQGDFTLTPQLAMSVDEIERPDVVIVALKNYHLEAALPQLRQLVAKGAKLLPLMNGVQHIDTLAAEVGPDSVIGGLCYIEATLDAEGNVIHTSAMHDVAFGPLSPVNQQLLADLESAFQNSGVHVTRSQSITVDMWRKFIFLTSFSGITAATQSTIGPILQDSVAMQFLEDMVREVISVARAKDVALPADAFEQVMKKLSEVPPTMTSSLHRDLQKGLSLEIDSLQGAVLKMASPLALETPCIRAVYALLHPHVNGARN